MSPYERIRTKGAALCGLRREGHVSLIARSAGGAPWVGAGDVQKPSVKMATKQPATDIYTIRISLPETSDREAVAVITTQVIVVVDLVVNYLLPNFEKSFIS